jgi:hypothetical protein
MRLRCGGHARGSLLASGFYPDHTFGLPPRLLLGRITPGKQIRRVEIDPQISQIYAD